jgi:DNA mismatch repair protein MutL
MRHIVDEFTRVALAFPQIFFSLTANNQQLFHLDLGNLKQRVLQLLGNTYNTKLVTVKENTDYMNITGFVGKPETAKKTRGDQYFFVNSRFIKSAYLNHAVMSAYEEMITKDSFPMYCLFIDLDPAVVDVNVHPTKQEIKFEDEKIIYAFVQAAVKHALAQFSISPTLDFSLNPDIQQLSSIQQPFTKEKESAAASSSIFKGFTQKNQAHFIEPSKRSELKHWKDFYEGPYSGVQGQRTDQANSESAIGSRESINEKPETFQSLLATHDSKLITDHSSLIQLHNQYIIAQTPSGFILIDQQTAHERVIYERLMAATKDKPVTTQRTMFPVTIEFAPADAVLVDDLRNDLHLLGFMIEPFGKNTFVIQGTPADIPQGNEKNAIDSLLEQYKHFSNELKFSKREKLIRSLAWQESIKPGTSLTEKEMKGLVEDLFKCATPNASPDGNPTYLEFKREQLEKMFGR